MASNFFPSKDSNETRIMRSKSGVIKTMTGNKTNEIIEEPFYSHLQEYQKGLQESIKFSEFVFESVDLLHYKFYKISLNRGGSYIDSIK